MDRNIRVNKTQSPPSIVALRKESVDRNFDTVQIVIVVVKSLSARRAWIEIQGVVSCPLFISWSLSARRAWIEISPAGCWRDARRASLSARRAWIEICPTCQWRRSVKVALRKESVDRNNSLESKQIDPSVSLSARRAWIEISCFWCIINLYESLSARRAWIEILLLSLLSRAVRVALRKESVDRNTFPIRWQFWPGLRRSPQGERG